MAKNSLSRKMAKKKNEPKKIEPRRALIKKILLLVVIFGLAWAACLFFKNSHYFKLDTIEVVDRNRASGLKASDLLTAYKGRNIFDININFLASRIKNDYPVIQDAIVKRVLPNTLEVDIVSRIPVAKIKIREYFPIDKTGMILSPEIKCGQLPVITGLSAWLRPRVGESLKNPRLKKAFLLLDALKESSVFLDYAVTTIDAANYKNLAFYLEDDIEVKIGGEDFPNRLAKLKTTLANPDLDRKNIKYIDLRFRDVVIGPK